MLVLWNLVNFLDGEARWILFLVSLLLGATIATHFIRIAIEKLSKRMTEKKLVWQSETLLLAYTPLCVYIWFATIVLCVDVISDHLFSDIIHMNSQTIVFIGAIVVLAWYAFLVKKKFIDNLIQKSRITKGGIDTPRIHGISKVITVAILIIAFFLFMEATGMSVNTLIAFGGIGGLALAISSQEVVANFFGGLMVYVTRQFTLGDKIQIPQSGLEGIVEEIGWYQTKVKTVEELPLYIPNSTFTKATVINESRKVLRKCKESFFLRPEDLEKIPQVFSDLKLALQQTQGVDQSKDILLYIQSIDSQYIHIYLILYSHLIKDVDFFAFRDILFLKVQNIIHKHNAHLATIQVYSVVGNS